MVSEIVVALLTGILVGALFALVDVPIPAPPNIAGILGIFGIYLGYKLVQWLAPNLDVAALLGL
jgi:XapX domain-containing protein